MIPLRLLGLARTVHLAPLQNGCGCCCCHGRPGGVGTGVLALCVLPRIIISLSAWRVLPVVLPRHGIWHLLLLLLDHVMVLPQRGMPWRRRGPYGPIWRSGPLERRACRTIGVETATADACIAVQSLARWSRSWDVGMDSTGCGGAGHARCAMASSHGHMLSVFWIAGAHRQVCPPLIARILVIGHLAAPSCACRVVIPAVAVLRIAIAVLCIVVSTTVCIRSGNRGCSWSVVGRAGRSRCRDRLAGC